MNARNDNPAVLAKSYTPSLVEKKWYDFWNSRGYFRAFEDSPGEAFSIVIPPPNVTGSLHMGHALEHTMHDVIVRWKRMQGCNTLWLPGTDHAGIFTQHVVSEELRKKGIGREGLGREKFVEKVWEWKREYGNTITSQMRRLGVSCDWSRERFTLDDSLSNAVREEFVRLHGEGLIYRGNYIINWCPSCKTALSDLEVEHRETKGKLYHIRYPLKDSGDYVVVATTRPETMLGDTAVAVHPEDDRYRKLVGKIVVLPLVSRMIPVIADASVDREFGTGAVKVTPGHDPNDFAMGLAHGLEVVNIFNQDATTNDNAGRFRGLDRYECRDRVVEALDSGGFFVGADDHAHAVGCCYRCGTVVEPYVSKQWFVRMKELSLPAVEAVRSGRIRFFPDYWKEEYYRWMENIRDWCISRQIWWGHRIPVWYCGDCGEANVSRDVPAACGKCGGRALVQDEDVLDTWFSSALWPFSTLGWPEATSALRVFYPTSLLITGWDILFFWVARMIVMGMKLAGDIPFRDVLIHPLIADEHGRKMSKSKGNIIDPLRSMDAYGTDALRFTMAGIAGEGRYSRLMEEQIQGSRNFANKIWNAARFVLMNVDACAEFKPRRLDASSLELADRWIMSRMSGSITRTGACLERYDFSEAAKGIYEFIWHEYCDWYLEIAKRDIGEGAPEARKMAVLSVLITVLENTMRLLHPFMPFITEEIWQELKGRGLATGGAESIMVSRYPSSAEGWADRGAEEAMERIMEIATAVRTIRWEMNIRRGRKCRAVIAVSDAVLEKALLENPDYLDRLAEVEEVDMGRTAAKPPQSASSVVSGAEVHIPLSGLIDFELETKRLSKALEKAIQEFDGLSKRLSATMDAGKAPEEVVSKQRDRVQELKLTVKRLTAHLESLKA